MWSEINFNHSKTDFELEGKHIRVSCRECHFDPTPENRLKQQFTWSSQSCTNCHKDIHYAQFEKKGENNCTRCHVFSNWEPEKFNHNTARFQLDGKHKGLECIQCHKPNDELPGNYIVYKFEDISCASCH
jgi:nitrate/TMAO reductase-like tetraheme cytochrome c subunit